MYAIRSYYEFNSNAEPIRCCEGSYPRESGFPQSGNEKQPALCECVITSYSIHYTKLYEVTGQVVYKENIKMTVVKEGFVEEKEIFE